MVKLTVAARLVAMVGTIKTILGNKKVINGKWKQKSQRHYVTLYPM